MIPEQKSLVCDCCGKRIMGQVVDGKLVIVNHNHGETHTVSIILEALKKEDLTKFQK